MRKRILGCFVVSIFFIFLGCNRNIAEKNYSGKKIVMAFMNWNGKPKGLERINTALSRYTKDKIGVEVELEIMDVSSYAQSLTLALSAGEKIDIFNAILIGYLQAVNKGFCLDLEKDNLIYKYGAKIVEILGKDLIDGCRINGILYGLPQQRDFAAGISCFAIAREYLDGINFKYDNNKEIIYTNIDTINRIFIEMKNKYPDKRVFVPTDNIMQMLPIDNIGNDYFGVLLSPDVNIEIGDLWSSKIFIDTVRLRHEWYKKGIIFKDALADTTPAVVQVKSGIAISYGTSGKPGIKQQETNLCGREMVIFQTGPDILRSSSIAAMPWVINSQSKDPIAAMKFLELCYTDPIVSNLLCWGEENIDYILLPDGHIDFPSGVTPEKAEYYNNVTWQMPNQFIAHVWKGNDLDIWERTIEFNKKALKSKAIGFIYDNSKVVNEFTALKNVYNEIVLPLWFGMYDPDKFIPILTNKMNEAGIIKYIDDKRSQIIKWNKK